MVLLAFTTACRATFRPRLASQLRFQNPTKVIARRTQVTKSSTSHEVRAKQPDSRKHCAAIDTSTATDVLANTDTSIPVPGTVPTLPLWRRLGPLSLFFQFYAHSQRTRPYLTQLISAVVIFFLGDLSAQSIGGEDYSAMRSGRALLIGAGASIPSYKWFLFLGNHFNYSSKAASLATKVVVNQLVFTPVNNSYFFGMQAMLSNFPNFDGPAVWSHIKRTVPPSMVNSLKLWPAVTAFNFTYIDAQYRNVFAGVVAIGWQTYLSYLNRTAEQSELLARQAQDDVLTTGQVDAQDAASITKASRAASHVQA